MENTERKINTIGNTIANVSIALNVFGWLGLAFLSEDPILGMFSRVILCTAVLLFCIGCGMMLYNEN